MEFGLNDTQRALRERVIAAVRAEIAHDVAAHDGAGLFPREEWRRLCALGMLGLSVAVEMGGQGCDAVTTVVALEALGYACRDNGLVFGVSGMLTSVTPALAQFADAPLRARYLAPFLCGDTLGCYAMTEADSGSDAFSMKSTALRDGDAYVLNGEKWFITFAPVADFALVYAATNPNAGKWGISLLVVDLRSPGVSASPVQAKMGLRTVPIGKLRFENVRVPAANLIGREGAGASMFNSGQEWERACILASQVGAMRRQLEDCVRFARERQAFGQPIGKFQAVSNRIADMKLRLETARLLTYQAAWAKDSGQPAMLDAALANLHVGETFVQNSMDAVRLFGGRGYLSEFEIERDLRDAVGGPIYGGTADIQRNIVARLLGL
jgi:alkylation response protein AidB-like acyl-CoA dehydrogenase